MAGRPTKMNDEVRKKIEEAAALGASIEEIAYYAGIHRQTLYEWREKDQELADRIEELQQRPILKSRQTIINGLDDVHNAQWYLERKKKNEFAQRTEQTGAEGTPLIGANDDLLRMANELSNKIQDTSV